MVIMDLNNSKEWSSEEFSENKKCCTDCKTTKTPLWRGGPAGPKTLCNACGIRYRKRRDTNPTVGMKQDSRKRERVEKTVANGGDGDLKESLKMKLMALGEEVLLKRSSSSSASVIVKKQRRMKKLGEEEQAAMCLMALSCGFVFA